MFVRPLLGVQKWRNLFLVRPHVAIEFAAFRERKYTAIDRFCGNGSIGKKSTK